MQLAVLLDENIVEDIVGHAVFIRLHDGGVRKRLVIGHVHAFVRKVEAVSHAAAVKSHVLKLRPEILKNFVVFFLVQIFRRRFRVVIAELNGNAVLAPALDISGQLIGGIVLIQYAVDTLFRCDLRHDLVGRLFHIALQMAGNIDTGDFIPVLPRKSEHLFRAAAGLNGKGRIDIYLMCGGDRIEHALKLTEIGKRLAAGEYKITRRCDLIHHGNAF